MAERDARIDRLLLGQEIADFLYREAKMLDERRYRERLDLLAGDVRYWKPIRRNVKLGDDESEFTRALSDINWFDEGKDTLSRRVKQIETGNSLGRAAALAPLAPRHLRAGAGRRTFLCRTPTPRCSRASRGRWPCGIRSAPIRPNAGAGSSSIAMRRPRSSASCAITKSATPARPA